MKKKNLASIAMALLAITTASAQRDVLKIDYLNGGVDYIPASEINRITFFESEDAESPLLQSVFAIFDETKTPMQLYSGHNDMGYPALMIGLDSQTEDMLTCDNPYNWFATWNKFQVHGNLTVPNAFMWRYNYSYIRLCNTVIATAAGSESDDVARWALAQAYAMRSFAYWNLVQVFAPNYAVNPLAPAIPIVNSTCQTDDEYPLATVQEVYNLIFSDIDYAESMLENNPIGAVNVDIQQAKRYVDMSVVYGLKARYNLTAHNYREAAQYARMAIDNSSARPLLPGAVPFPGFNDSKLSNWMWGITMQEGDMAVTSGIVNFTSQMSGVYSGGYTYVGVPKYCGAELHSYLQRNNDLRLNWFTDEYGNASHLARGYQNILENMYYNSGRKPFISFKFDVYNSDLDANASQQICDIPLMRIEEMYLIAAEGEIMSGNTYAGAELLKNFVRGYRAPEYDVPSMSQQDLQEEVLWQRRAELWGEGLVFFDKLRLQLDMDRTSDENVDNLFRIRLKGDSPWMLYAIPRHAPFVEGYDYGEDPSTPDSPQPNGSWY